jgi:hypothetical protein
MLAILGMFLRGEDGFRAYNCVNANNKNIQSRASRECQFSGVR